MHRSQRRCLKLIINSFLNELKKTTRTPGETIRSELLISNIKSEGFYSRRVPNGSTNGCLDESKECDRVSHLTVAKVRRGSISGLTDVETIYVLATFYKLLYPPIFQFHCPTVRVDLSSSDPVYPHCCLVYPW